MPQLRRQSPIVYGAPWHPYAGSGVSEAPRRAPLLYDLVTLQRQAAQWLGFTPRRTLDAAQECYERAVLSYPGTASRYLPSELAGELREIATHVGRARAAYREPAGHVEALAELPLGRVVDDAKVGDHHALIPTNAAHVLSALGDDARSIYELVARRFLAVFLPPATFEDTIVVTRIEGDWFLSHERVPRDPGWYAAYDEPLREKAMTGAGATDRELPELSEGLEVRCVRAEIRHLRAAPERTSMTRRCSRRCSGRRTRRRSSGWSRSATSCATARRSARPRRGCR